jgi:exosortase
VVSLTEDARRNPVGAAGAPLALVGAALIVALAFLYTPLWAVCWKEWWRKDSAYSHGILIPFLALVMIWWRKEAWQGLQIRPAASALVPLLLGLALQLLARWAHSTMLSWASFLLVLTASVAFVIGWRMTFHLLPPLLYLTFMVPMSQMVTGKVVLAAQMISTRLADLYLTLMGFQTELFGTIIRMENYTLEVALPCSGFKTLIALTAFAAFFIYLLRGSLPRKLILFGAALALSLLVNALRISLVGVTGELYSADAAHWVHDNGGLPVTALALGGLYLMARMLKCSLVTPGSSS